LSYLGVIKRIIPKAQRFQQTARFLVATQFIQCNELQRKSVSTKWSGLWCNYRDTNWIVTVGWLLQVASTVSQS